MLAPPNLEEASQFLLALSPDSLHTFLTFDDSESERKSLTRTYNGTFQSEAESLASSNDKGAGVFVLVNQGNGKSRKATDIKAVRAVFVDLDGAPLEPVLNAPVPPTIIVETSPNKYHAYWPVFGLSLDQFKPAQQALAAIFNGDRQVCDLSRVLRIPGFYHRKSAPFLSRLMKCELMPPYNWLDFVNAMGLVIAAPKLRRVLPSTIPEGSRNNELYGLAYGLRQQGFSQSDGHSRLAIVNMERCKPPVSDGELVAIVASAWAKPIKGFTAIPNEVLDSPEFATLPSEGKLALVKAYRSYNGANNGSVPLTNSGMLSWGMSRRVASRGRIAAIEAGLLKQTKKATSTNPKPALFELSYVVKTSGGQISPLASDKVGVKSDHPK